MITTEPQAGTRLIDLGDRGAHDGADLRADTITGTAVLNCLWREVTAVGGRLVEDQVYVTIELPRTGTLLRARHGRWASEPERLVGAAWQPMAWHELAGAVCEELARHSGRPGHGLLTEIADSHMAISAILRARAAAAMPDELYRRSEQALVAGHRYHPAPKARGGIAAEHWLPYAPEAHASFPLRDLGVRADVVVDEGDTAALDAMGLGVPDGYRLLPAHPWQLTLLRDVSPPGDDRLLRLGPADHPVWPTSSVRTVYDPAADVFFKFSLEVRITNDVRRLWRYDLRWIAPLAVLLRAVFADIATICPGTAFLIDRGYRTVGVGDMDLYEGLAVVVRDGVRAHVAPGVTPLLAAGISEGFTGNPLDRLDADAALTWWRRYLAVVVPPALRAFFHHGVVLECHLQNVLVGVDSDGMPVQAIFRDHEGVRLVASRHADLLREIDGPHALARGLVAERGWQRLQYCLISNHLHEIAGAVVERHPALATEVWTEARVAFLAYGREHGSARELGALVDTPHLPTKTNMLLRWSDADGAASAYASFPNPLRG